VSRVHKVSLISRLKALLRKQQPKVRLDWPAYFEDFCEQHGKFYVEFRGRLLFEDGWQYSATDYAGPEWPPLEDSKQLLVLQRQYWKLRLRQSLELAFKARVVAKGIENLQRAKSGTLQERRGKKVAPVDVEALEGRKQWLEDDVELCKEKLTELGVQPDANVSSDA
jgi:hypothetical protein